MYAVKVDVRSLQRGFDALAKAGASPDLDDVFRELRGPMRADQKEHAQRQEGPEGPWPERAASTLQRSKRRRRGTKTAKRGRSRSRGGRPRRMLGRLPTSVKVRAQGLSVWSHTPVPWAGIHQEGGLAGRRSLIPARPFIYISDELERLAMRMIADHVVEPWSGR